MVELLLPGVAEYAPHRSAVSDDDFHVNFDTSVVLPAAGDDGYKWGEPADRDPHLWGEITLTGAPEHLNGEPLIGAKLTIECWWCGDDPTVDVYEFEIDIEGELYGSSLDHIHNRPECVRLTDQWSYPPADIVVRAIDAKRRRDRDRLHKV